ncbi:hypothetical protein LCGC14_0593410 [marine sediment metagenome]|uniref:Uncharacterized protein n=1 Tax=marine sediment metagenome TaxID=412755 RepID=A0A0F9ULB4_9ZZZZ
MWRKTKNGDIEVVNERPTVRRSAVIEAGSCMGCNSKGMTKVTKLTSPNNTEIRLCDKCVKEMRNAT